MVPPGKEDRVGRIVSNRGPDCTDDLAYPAAQAVDEATLELEGVT